MISKRDSKIDGSMTNSGSPLGFENRPWTSAMRCGVARTRMSISTSTSPSMPIRRLCHSPQISYKKVIELLSLLPIILLR